MVTCGIHRNTPKYTLLSLPLSVPVSLPLLDTLTSYLQGCVDIQDIMNTWIRRSVHPHVGTVCNTLHQDTCKQGLLCS